MSKRQKEFHDSLANEKTRVRLYKSGKNWVKSGIKEIEMFKIMGLPFISHSMVSQDNQSISKKNDWIRTENDGSDRRGFHGKHVA
ncbi:LPXTG cell wall surface anchor family protein [Staphylococcus aureus]|nr:LPXTG cell wall surface anchor family protein [Staphylococcus aureus]